MGPPVPPERAFDNLAPIQAVRASLPTRSHRAGGAFLLPPLVGQRFQLSLPESRIHFGGLLGVDFVQPRCDRVCILLPEKSRDSSNTARCEKTPSTAVTAGF